MLRVGRNNFQHALGHRPLVFTGNGQSMASTGVILGDVQPGSYDPTPVAVLLDRRRARATLKPKTSKHGVPAKAIENSMRFVPVDHRCCGGVLPVMASSRNGLPKPCGRWCATRRHVSSHEDRILWPAARMIRARRTGFVKMGLWLETGTITTPLACTTCPVGSTRSPEMS